MGFKKYRLTLDKNRNKKIRNSEIVAYYEKNPDFFRCAKFQNFLSNFHRLRCILKNFRSKFCRLTKNSKNLRKYQDFLSNFRELKFCFLNRKQKISKWKRKLKKLNYKSWKKPNNCVRSKKFKKHCNFFVEKTFEFDFW